MACSNCGSTRTTTKTEQTHRSSEVIETTYVICSDCGKELSKSSTSYAKNYPKDPKSDKHW